MYIKKLVISESHPAEKIIRTVTFQKGPNFIVDASNSEDERGNGVGKTTTLKVMDICLGAQERKYIYTDEEIGAENSKLKTYLYDSKVYAELTIVDSLEIETVRHTLRVELFERGGRFLDNVRLSYLDYNKELNRLFFDIEAEKPTFRQLVGMFVRVDQKSDNDRFLKYLDSHTADTIYENVYSFLFRLSDIASSQEVLTLKEKIKALRSDIKKLMRLNSITSINVVQQKMITIDRDIDSIKRKLGALIDAKEMKKNEEAMASVRAQYAAIADEIDKYHFRLQRISATIESARDEAGKKIDRTVLKNLYEDTASNFEGLIKTFDDLVAFNEQLLANKVTYFESQLKRVKQRLAELTKQKNDLLNKYQDVVVLIKDSDIDNYVSLQGRLEATSQEKGKLEKIIELYDTHMTALEEAEHELESWQKNETNPSESIATFNKYFTEYSRKIIKEEYLLFLTEKTFPLGLENVSTGISTGTKKSVISAFDLAYQSFAKEREIAAPSFLVHDVIETMDKLALNNTIQLSRSLGCQYIVAVLNDKIEGNDKVAASDIRLTLSDANKLFRM
ncbi:MAG TPA: DUF2326 domain-containing protein [Candidatus Saccharimonadales bacterium]|nr:DUF2326 domain-containing protein [Candidatus Saccharimonadales bacterium]